jgi:midasin (ATPase involved in ribosome maturation)
VLTRSTRENLRRIARVLVTRKYPVLLQGPTSSGKTSMVEYLARRTGHRFVRINNHEHTDLQEYLGSYVADDKGKLVFREGLLVEAVRKVSPHWLPAFLVPAGCVCVAHGMLYHPAPPPPPPQGYWLVLDELNLAPTDVLEALNRLLDDNRELVIPETQETIKPHPHFQLFATQNPPGIYGGRKVLSRAFRNRFVELHFDDIPEDELATILELRAAIPPSYCKKLIAILKDLQKRRQGTRLFAGKHGFVTLRDLFRWAERRATGYQALAHDGYMVLAEKVRRPDEKAVVKETIEAHLKYALNDGVGCPRPNPS